MKRILLAFLLMLPVMSAVNRATSDPMPDPCFPCNPPWPPDGTKGGVVIELPLSMR
ncbi:MAG: hypothetical protein KatS3mg004_3391 [Bryobacteraceae bacterium]|nr:MAG: hypothetical protein KatS3mg004_3391 [Bryobacteraceae bacterium]